MELLVAKDKDKDMWVGYVGKRKTDSPPTPLAPASESIYRVILAITQVYPQSRVFIDPSISNNPFLYQMLTATRLYDMPPDPGLVQRALENSEVKECDFCHASAYYNPRKRLWICTRCTAVEWVDGEFIKVRKWGYSG